MESSRKQRVASAPDAWKVKKKKRK